MSSDEDDISIISSLGTMDHVDGDFTHTARPPPHSGPIPEFHFYSSSQGPTSGAITQRLPESLHALTVAYSSLKHRFNDLQRKNIELEKKMQSQRQMPQTPDGLDYTDYRYPSRTEFDGTSASGARQTGNGLIAHGGRRSPELELEQENEILQKQKVKLERQLRDREAECETLRMKLKDMEDVCQQITSSNMAMTSTATAQLQRKEMQADSAETDDGDEDTEESETTTELTEKYAAMMRDIMSELSLSKRTIEQQQQMIENLQLSMAGNTAQAAASRGDAEGGEHVAPAGARPKARGADVRPVDSRPVDPVQCTDNDLVAGYRPAPLSDWTSISPQQNALLGPVAEPTRDVTPRGVAIAPSNARSKSVSVPVNIGGHAQRSKPSKQRSQSSSMEPALDHKQSPGRDLAPHLEALARIESDSVDSAEVMADRFDVFGRPNQDTSFERVTASNIFSDNADDLYGNDTLVGDLPKRTELRRRQSDREVRDDPCHRYEPLRQSWPVSVTTAPRSEPDGSVESNRYRLGDRPHPPRPLNIDRNVAEPVASRSHDNTRNVNLLPDPAPVNTQHNYGVLNNDPLVASKPVPHHNIYHEGQDLTVNLPPVEQAERGEEPKTCPVCSQEFPAAFAQSDFEEHVVVCLNTSSGENSPGGGERACPVCSQLFPKAVPQTEFEDHVNGHFDDFEVVPRSSPRSSPEVNAVANEAATDNFGSPGEPQ